MGRSRSTIVVLALAVLLAGTMAGSGADRKQLGGAMTVRSWVSTPDGSHRLDPGPTRTFAAGGPSAGPVIDVDADQRFQTMAGFGASITDSSASLLQQLPAAQRDQAMRSLFSPTDGIGLSVLRQPIGASDFVTGGHYTFDDRPPGETDYQMEHFALGPDQQSVLDLLREARRLNPELTVMATPWSPPAWMKTTGSLIGGRLIGDPAVYRAYALYLVKFIQAYQSAGVPVDAITVQNEPLNSSPNGYPGTDMPAPAQAAVINVLGPMLRDAGLGSVKILSYDHNWSARTPPAGATAGSSSGAAAAGYPFDILRSSASRWITGTAFHCYAGDPSVQTQLHDAFPDKGIFLTECSGWRPAGLSSSAAYSDTFRWQADTLLLGAIRNWASSVATWNAALDASGGPGKGGCANASGGTCTGVLTIDGTGVSRNADYDTLGQVSKFVVPGAVRIASTDAGDVRTVAFHNPDGSMVLVAVNGADADRDFTVRCQGRTVGYPIPAGAVMTLAWNAGGVSA